MFWVLKVLTTGMGEAASDFLGHISIPLAGIVGLSGMALGLGMQLRVREYRAPVYWFAVLMVAVFGTMAADGVHVAGGVPYAVTTPFYAAVVAAVFFFWHRSERTLSIHSITTQRREAFYWTAVLATFALGTAAGDLTAISLNMGYLASAVLFAVAIAVPAIAWRRFGLHPIVAFWAAYVITRPLGASVADWIGKPVDKTGLGLGDGTVTALALLVFVALVARVATARNDIQRPGDERAQPRGPRPAAREGARIRPAEG